MSDLPEPETLTRQPGTVSTGGTDQPPEAAAPSPEEAAAEFRQQLEAANRAREVAETEARQAREREAEARNRATTADTNAFSAHERALETELGAQTALVEQAKVAIANAQAAGDTLAVADAFDKLAEARAAIRDLNNRKTWLASQKQQQATQQPQPAGNALRVTTPGGAMDVAPAAKEWMDQHTRFYTDGDYYNHAVAAHSRITSQGVQEGSPMYFRELSAAMQRYEQFEAFERGEQQQPTNGNGQMASQQQQRRMPASSMGAPVSRATATVSRDGTVDPLTVARRIGENVTVADLREFARINGYGKDEAGFQRYLKDQHEIGEIERGGGDTGLRVDGVYR